MRRAILVACVAVLVGVAGCSAVPGVGDGDGGRATGDGTDGQGDDSGQFGPARLSNASVTDRLVDLSTLSSYTVRVNLSFSNRTSTRPYVTTTARVDGETGLARTRTRLGTVVRYTAPPEEGNVTYQRRVSPDGTVRYSAASPPYDGRIRPADAAGDATAGLGGSNLSVSRSGTRQYRGETVAVYTATRRNVSGAPFGGSLGGFFRGVTFDRQETTVYLDRDGDVRLLNVTVFARGENRGRLRLSFTYELYGVGSTTVREPDWIEEARNQTGG